MLEHIVKSNQMALRVIERALNDPDGWVLACGIPSARAQVLTHEHGVTIWAAFDETPGYDTNQVFVWHRGVLLWVKEIDLAGVTAPFEVELNLAVAETVAV